MKSIRSITDRTGSHYRRWTGACPAETFRNPIPFGAVLDKPAIGCAKSRLWGRHKEPKNEAGCYEYLYDEGENIRYKAEIDLIRDHRNWAIGPHSDKRINIAVIILYLPSDDTKSHLGTSIYTPKESGFTCAGGPHHDRKKFDLANTVPYLPNSAISFFRNDVSFHGFEAVQNAGDVRNLIQISVIRTS